jgi:hypothetical protein
MPAVLHDLPVCFDCQTRIENSPVFAAICGHATCPSVVFHGLCLMEWREKQQRAAADGVETYLGVFAVKHAPGCPNA